VGPREFYVVNDSGFREKDASERRKFWTSKLRSNRATALYFDGTKMKVVAGNLEMASGIAVSPDGETVYVAESSGSRLTLFDRDLATGELKLKTRIDLEISPHNLTVDTAGNVWVAGRPFGSFLRNLGDRTARVPTHVLKLPAGAERSEKITETYVNDGAEISSGSVAAARGRQLLIGSYADRKLLLCTQGGAANTAPKPVISGPEKDT
jgi:arylesterase / paraoxonase